jgi:type I restriction enzyme S subunit
MTGAGSVGNIGKMRRVEKVFLGNQRVGIIRIKTNLADPEFVYQVLSNEDVENKNYQLGLGTGQPNLSPKMIGGHSIPLPPMPTQRRIAEILSAYDDLIEVNARRIRILEGMAQSVYRETVPAPSLRGAVETLSTTSPLPEGWEIKKLGDIAKEVRRSIQPSEIDPETPYFGLEHLPRKSLALSDWGKAGDVQSTKLAFKKGEILFGKIRPYFHKVGVGPQNGVASSDTIIIVPKSPEYFGLVLGCVFSEEFVNHATLTSQGTKMPRANWDVLVKYPVAIPPKPLLEQFNQTTKDFVDLIQNLLFRNRNLRRTRDLLLPRLVGGEVAV